MSQPPDLATKTIEAYLSYLAHERRLSKHTITNYRRDLTVLQQLAVQHDDHRQQTTAANVNENGLNAHDLRRYLAQLHSQGLDARSIARTLSAWRGYFDYLIQQGIRSHNPATGLRAPKAGKRLPDSLSPDEAIQLVSFAGTAPVDICDRAMFELLYSSGLRISELTNLNLDAIDLSATEVRVTGKGNKTRIVPIGKSALTALQNWLPLRATLPGADSPALFLGPRGNRISQRLIQLRIKRRAQQQGLSMPLHPHMLRHSFASHVLQSSGDLRAVQEMLGHSSISSTQVYTHLDFQHLAKIYDTAHPRAKKK